MQFYGRYRIAQLHPDLNHDFFFRETQPGLLRHPVLQRGLLRDRGAAGETSEVDRRRTRRTFYTEAHHVFVPVLPLAALPHHVHP